MGISYRKLRELLIERKMKRLDLHKQAGIGNVTLSKINKDEYMDMESLERIARYLEVDIGDIVEIKK